MQLLTHSVEQRPMETVVYGDYINVLKPMWWFIDVKFRGHAAKQSVQLNRRNGTTINEKLGEILYTSQMKDDAAACKDFKSS